MPFRLDFLEGGAGLNLCAPLGEKHLGLYYIIIEDTVADDGHHLNDDDLVTVLGETLSGLKAGHAAADDGDRLAAHLHIAAQHVEGGNALLNAGDAAGNDGLTATCEDDGVGVLFLELVEHRSGNLSVEVDFDVGILGDLAAVPCDEVIHAELVGRLV